MLIKAIFFDLSQTLVTSTRSWLPGAKELLTALKAHGMPLGIISNTGNLATRQAILNLLPTDFNLHVFQPEWVFFSSEVGIAKPNKEIFQKAVIATDLPAPQCLYCSEDMVETLVAQHVGMRTMRVQTPPNTDLDQWINYLERYEEVIGLSDSARHAPLC